MGSYSNMLALQNIGNSCYLNSSLQCLLSVPEFNEYILKQEIVQQSPIYSLIYDLCKKYKDPKIPISNPSLLKEMLGSQNNFFKGFNQQDCHECLVNLLDILHNHGKRLSRDGRSLGPNCGTEVGKIAKKSWDSYIETFGNTYITQLFTGQIRILLECNVCGFSRNMFDIVNNISLSLPIGPHSIDIVDCFRDFFGKEILSEGDSVICEKCKKKTPTTKSNYFWRYPKILVLHLKRYIVTNNGYLRNNCVVDFTTEISFAAPKMNYTLLCVVNHLGNTPNGGHYTSMIKHKEGWIHVDDSSIYKCEEKNICSSSSYILIYRLNSQCLV